VPTRVSLVRIDDANLCVNGGKCSCSLHKGNSNVDGTSKQQPVGPEVFPFYQVKSEYVTVSPDGAWRVWVRLTASLTQDWRRRAS
jgi:hypothetical protein